MRRSSSSLNWRRHENCLVRKKRSEYHPLSLKNDMRAPLEKGDERVVFLLSWKRRRDLFFRIELRWSSSSLVEWRHESSKWVSSSLFEKMTRELPSKKGMRGSSSFCLQRKDEISFSKSNWDGRRRTSTTTATIATTTTTITIVIRIVVVRVVKEWDGCGRLGFRIEMRPSWYLLLKWGSDASPGKKKRVAHWKKTCDGRHLLAVRSDISRHLVERTWGGRHPPSTGEDMNIVS